MAGIPAAEVDVTPTLVRALLAEQHPDLADLPLVPFAHGWDNVMLRLGDALVVRVPRRRMAAEVIEHEQRWLPQLAPRLPVQVPVPVRVGTPAAGFPWSWSVLPWIDGDPLAAAPVAERGGCAVPLARTLATLHAPAPDDVWSSPYRGGPLAPRAELVRGRLAELAGRDPADGGLDARAVDRLLGDWETALSLPHPPGPRLWVHGDVHPLNLLVRDGELAAIIDWGDVAAGDPACDLAVAWLGFTAADGAVFRRAYDDAARHHLDLDPLWDRARGWAVHLGTTLALGSDDHPVLHAVGRHALGRVVSDAP